MTNSATSLLSNEHPFRRDLYREIHSRPFPQVDGPVCITHLTVTNGASTKEERRAHLAELASHFSIVEPLADEDCYYHRVGDLDLRWEQHTEFCTYTFICPNNEREPFSSTSWELLPKGWREALPGDVITAVHLEIITCSQGFPSRDLIRPWFEGLSLVGGELPGGQAQLWTTFRLHSDDFGRLIIYNKHLTECDLGRLLRCVLELTGYRVMSLLALPQARKLIPQVSEQEKQLASLIEKIPGLENIEDERKLLAQLSQLSASLEQLIAESNYRFDATEAYFELTSSRLEELDERAIPNVVTLREFLVRRLTPAVRTSMSVRERMHKLSLRIERATNLLRTRVNVAMEEQNRELLDAMNRRGVVQLRLQQTVEGLSVVAISYYLIQLLEYVLIGFNPSLYFSVESEVIVALAVPAIVLGVWLGVRSIRGRWPQR